MPVGHPFKFKTVSELEKKIQEYFDSCFEFKWEDEEVRDTEGNKTYIRISGDTVPAVKHIKKRIPLKIPTVSELAVFLETTRRTLLDYEDNYEEYSHTIKRAKAAIEAFTESGMINGKINPASAIFNLKNNWGWKDEIHNINLPVELSDEQKKKMDELLLNKPNENNKPTSTGKNENGDKTGA